MRQRAMWYHLPVVCTRFPRVPINNFFFSYANRRKARGFMVAHVGTVYVEVTPAEYLRATCLLRTFVLQIVIVDACTHVPTLSTWRVYVDVGHEPRTNYGWLRNVLRRTAMSTRRRRKQRSSRMRKWGNKNNNKKKKKNIVGKIMYQIRVKEGGGRREE